MAQEIDIPFEKHVLDNGLEVVLHEDHSDPVVAVYVYYHVGSAREEVGRSGFAHLFEHMMFQGSQHVGDDQHFKLVQEGGGTLNGTTNRDRTNYFETLPANQLELALWLESDRMGFLLPSVTLEKLDNQREVVKNERRQNYENRPYGREAGATTAALYPADHPYSWLTIGSHEDLTNASLEDVHAFFRRWYGPNNATLAIGGDIDPTRTLELVRKYFGSIPRGPAVAKPAPRPVSLEGDRRVVIEDNVRLPQLTFTWPTVPMFHEDEPALSMLASILSANKSSILDRGLTIDRTLATRVSAYASGGELAGEFEITLQPKPGVSLDQLELETRALITKLLADGIDPAQLERTKNRYEADVVRRLETASSRTSHLAHFNTFLGTPDYAAESLAKHLAVTPDDVRRVLERYVAGRPAVLVSTVPAGQLPLAASGRNQDALAQEASLDRTRKPEPGPEPPFHSPRVWHSELANGVRVTGTPYTELPLAQIDLYVPAGRLHADPAQAGIASLTARLLNDGTRELSTTELTEELEAIGARLSIRSDDQEIELSLNVLEKHLPRAVELLGDIITEPRFAEDDFERAKDDRLVAIRTRDDDIAETAQRAFMRLMFGDTPRGTASQGTEETISRLTRDDVAAFWASNGIPNGARMTVVGNLDADDVDDLFAALTERWKAREPGLIEASFQAGEELADGEPVVVAGLYLIDKAGASQSQIRIGQRSIAATHPDWYGLSVLNYILGGSFSSRINLNLREDKGYTYGARSRFTGDVLPGSFVASSGVRGDVTKESVVEFMKELGAILEGVTDEELAFTKKALVQAMGRRFESTGALGAFLNEISTYGHPDNYLELRLNELMELAPADLRALARKHLDPEQMVILVVGDEAAVEPGLAHLGYGKVRPLDIDGRPAQN
jgi:zinc protease